MIKTPHEVKEMVVCAWLLQTEKYAAGPVDGVCYCSGGSCLLCRLLRYVDDYQTCELCPLSMNRVEGCTFHKTYTHLLNHVTACGNGLTVLAQAITDELIDAMALRHRFYIRAHEEVLKDAPPERFASGEGFPELLEIDRELAKEII